MIRKSLVFDVGICSYCGAKIVYNSIEGKPKNPCPQCGCGANEEKPTMRQQARGPQVVVNGQVLTPEQAEEFMRMQQGHT